MMRGWIMIHLRRWIGRFFAREYYWRRGNAPARTPPAGRPNGPALPNARVRAFIAPVTPRRDKGPSIAQRHRAQRRQRVQAIRAAR